MILAIDCTRFWYNRLFIQRMRRIKYLGCRLYRQVVVGAICISAAIPGIAAEKADETQPQNHVVIIEAFQFVPQVLDVSAGDTITWINKDMVPHTATAVDESWDTDEISAGEQATVMVNSEMLQQYYCRYHPAMVAELTLIAASSTE